MFIFVRVNSVLISLNSQPLFGSCPGSMAHSRKVSFGRDRGNEPKSVWEFRLCADYLPRDSNCDVFLSAILKIPENEARPCWLFGPPVISSTWNIFKRRLKVQLGTREKINVNMRYLRRVNLLRVTDHMSKLNGNEVFRITGNKFGPG